MPRTLTYNFGGAAAGIDYRLDPRFLVGIGVGYTHGTQWVNTFMGQGWSDSVSVAAYGSFTPMRGFYVDALAGYAYSNNQLQRQILIPGLQQRTATGSTGANQFLGQIEAGYKIDVYAPAMASITPFGRFQISSVTQNAFNESGAQSLNLNVAQQTTNSQRTTIGADLGSSIGLGNERKLDLAVRLGWQHEFADTGRPITAAFAGAPGNAFTVFGATPARDSAVVGLLASTTIAAATQVYLRYDGDVGGGTDNHAAQSGRALQLVTAPPRPLVEADSTVKDAHFQSLSISSRAVLDGARPVLDMPHNRGDRRTAGRGLAGCSKRHRSGPRKMLHSPEV